LRRLLRTADEETQAPARAEAELRALPAVRLEHLVPPIDWVPAAEALDHTLAAGSPRGTSCPAVRFLIGQPHCGHAETLRHWAQAQGARILSPPRYEEHGPHRPWPIGFLGRHLRRRFAEARTVWGLMPSAYITTSAPQLS
jgi:hypothetical protein